MSEPDEAKKGGTEILQVQRREAEAEFDRPAMGVALSGLSAGLDLGFSLLLMAVVTRLLANSPTPLLEVSVALSYSLGFLFVILGRSELFTEHTTLDILPVLAGKRSLWGLLRLWALIYCSNLAGAVVISYLMAHLGPDLGIFPAEVLGAIATGVVSHPSKVIFFSGVFAGWLMGLLSWLVAASRDTISQIVVIILVTGTLGLCHLHHCVAGSIEVLSSIFAAQAVTWGEYGRFLGCATLGNALGGSIFVALIKTGHIEMKA